ncbi:olfactory receptor 10C1-like [Anomaloglossus baeobatrachus]|uniref:olfactory receptor 10C1-like n=1 Tax=Anomaloglossus baeobatrachus TaxID=238106 RepID=UPI003F4FB5C6
MSSAGVGALCFIEIKVHTAVYQLPACLCRQAFGDGNFISSWTWDLSTLPKVVSKSKMQHVNRTIVNEFYLLGFIHLHSFQNLLFCAVLLAYTICVLGNFTIIMLVRTQPSLHSPMYFFIGIFTVLEIVFASVTIPKLLAILIQTKKTISLFGCFVQMYTFNALGETECFLLALMVFDRYLAITNPLRYSAIMYNQFCFRLSVLPWFLGFMTSFIPSIFTFLLDFCGPNEVDHFFCDLAPLQNLSCSDPFLSNVTTSLAAVMATVLPFFTIMGFYIHIIYTVLKIESIQGKTKAFSTCSSHLIVASLFYGSAIIVYVRPKGSHYDKFLALIYTVIIPVLNPFIYTFRNRERRPKFNFLATKVNLIMPWGCF